MPRPHPHLGFATAGLTVAEPRPVENHDNTEADAVAKQGTRPELVDILPQFEHRTCYFNEITLPANTIFGKTAEAMSACFCLGRYRPSLQVGEEFALAGVNVEMLPSDSAGGLTTTALGAGSSTGWGATNGLNACIVIGESLQIDQGSWAGRRIYAAGLETGANNLVVPSRPEEYIEVLTFPTGKFNDTTPNKISLPLSYLPTQRPITAFNSVDVLLCIRATQLASNSGGNMSSGGADKAILGYAKITLRFMKTIRSAFYRR